MRTWHSGIAGLAFVLLLAACATPPPPHEAVPPPSGAALEAPPQEAVEVEPAGAPAEEPLSSEYVPVESTSREALVIAVPEASGWTNPDVPLTRRQGDIEACYGYAAAQVARDEQIDSDRHQAREDANDVTGLTTLTRRVDFYSQSRRRDSLFASCMRAKGYFER